MKIWLPYTYARSGSTVFINNLAQGLRARGLEAVTQEFPHLFQFFPKALRLISPPPQTDIIITNTWNGPGFHRSNIPAICVEHLFVLDHRLKGYKSPAQDLFHTSLIRSFVRESYRTASKVVAVSEYTRRAVLEVFPKTDIRVILNGINEAFFTPGEQRWTSRDANDKFELLFVGNLSRRKGADLLPDIMARLGPDFVLRYTGGAGTAPTGFDAANFVPLGRLSQSEIRDEYRRCDALIAPTRMEGLPLAVLEAAACGLPIIASDSASLPEAVIDRVTGLICPVDDPASFADAARYLREHPHEARGMREQARNMAAQRFSFERMVEEYVGLIRSLV
jgi:alpha-maltose-1-phosphate synthase